MSRYNILCIENARGFGGTTTSLAYFLWNLNREKYLPYVVCSYDSAFWQKRGEINVRVVKTKLP